MYRISRFRVIRTATTVGLGFGLAFALIGVPLLLVGLINTPQGGALAGFAIVIAMVGAIVLVVVLPLLIWLLTAVACVFYNLAARWVGGVSIDVERMAPAGQHTASYGQYPPGELPTAPQGWSQYPPQPGWNQQAGQRYPDQAAGQRSPGQPTGQRPPDQPA